MSAEIMLSELIEKYDNYFLAHDTRFIRAQDVVKDLEALQKELGLTPHVVELSHHVVLKNGREDIVCACGEFFRSTLSPNKMSGCDAITQWVAHYNETKPNILG